MNTFYSSTVGKVIEMVNTNVDRGLTTEECLKRKEEQGDNKIYLPYSKGFLKLILDLIYEKYIYIYLVFIILFAFNNFYEVSIISAIILILNIVFKIYYEFEKEKEINLLQNLNISQVLVLRDNKEQLIEAEDLVKGDIVYFRKNSLISADIRIIESEDLKIDERSVTGDKFLKSKYSNKMEEKKYSIGDINNILFRGSFVKSGTGTGIVIETGNNTELGKLMSVIENTKKKKHLELKNVQKELFNIGLCLILIQFILIVVFPGKITNKIPLLVNGIFAILCIFVPSIAIVYSRYIKKELLSSQEIELNNFSALQLSKKVKIFFLDKVGAITKNELNLKMLYTNDQSFNFEDIKELDINIERLIDISILSNNGKYNVASNWSSGDIYEVAYMKSASEKGIIKTKIDNKNRRLFEVPRTSDKRLMTIVNKSHKKGYRANTRGDLTSVLDCCTNILVNGLEKDITSEDIMKINLTYVEYSKLGYTTEAFAYRSFNYEPSEYENVESNLVFVGLITLENPLVDEINDEISTLVSKGVLPIIFTEDNKIVSEFIGRKIGLITQEDQISSVEDIKDLDDEKLLEVVSRTRIYSKITPEFKNKIVNLYKESNYDFAMEGETLSDISLVSLSKLGIIKTNFSLLLKKIGDIYTTKSSIKSFLALRETNKKVENSISRGLIMYTMVVLMEIMIFSLYQLTSKDYNIEYLFILFTNVILLTPVLLMNMIYGKREESSKKVIIRYTLFTLIPVLGSYLSQNNYQVVSYVLIGLIMLIDSVLNNNLIRDRNLKGIKLLLIFIGLFILTSIVLVFLNNYTYFVIDLVIVGSLSLIFLISEIIIKRW